MRLPLTFQRTHEEAVADEVESAAGTSSESVVNLVDEGVDVAIRIAHLADSALVATKVGEVRRVVCASPGYLARHGRPRTPGDLGSHRCVSCSALTPSDTWTFGAKRGRRGTRVAVHPALTVNTAEAAIGSAIDGRGVTCVLSYQVATALREGQLLRVLEAHESAPLPVHLVLPGGSTSIARVRAFVEMAVPRLRSALA